MHQNSGMNFEVIIMICVVLVFIQVMNVRTRLETFLNTDDFEIIASDSFPCSANPDDNFHDPEQTHPKQGCYYKELGGCAFFPKKGNMVTCPKSLTEIAEQGYPEPRAINENIFEYIYDAMKNNKKTKDCPDNEQQVCPMDFFKRLSVMTDAEVSHYMSILSSRPCSIGAVCLTPDNISRYIAASSNTAKSQKTTCEMAEKEKNTLQNELSRQMYSRIFPQCEFGESQKLINTKIR